MSKIRTTDLIRKKAAGEKIPVLTAYDATMAALLERAGIDVLLVGDSLGMVVLGHETTVPVTMADMLHHTKAVSRGAHHALIVSDMPFLSYEVSADETLRNAGQLLAEGGAAAVKLEGAHLETVRRLVDAGIPVMGHLGLLPQHVNQLGGFRKQGQTESSARQLIADALALQESGAFSLVLESIPDELAAEVTALLSIPTIGIGAGPHCDGQVLVSNDLLGLTTGSIPPFAKQYAHLGSQIVDAAQRYIGDVTAGEFPAHPVAHASR